MPPKGTHIGEQIPAQPFVDWLNDRYARYRAAHEHMWHMSGRTDPDAVLPLSPLKRLAADLGWGGLAADRIVYRYRHGRDGMDRPTETFRRATVEDALEHAGLRLEDVYPEFAVDVVLEPDAFCGLCREMVTPIDGVCPWCDTEVRSGRPLRSIRREAA